jgi:hypothetical protein
LLAENMAGAENVKSCTPKTRGCGNQGVPRAEARLGRGARFREPEGPLPRTESPGPPPQSP